MCLCDVWKSLCCGQVGEGGRARGRTSKGEEEDKRQDIEQEEVGMGEGILGQERSSERGMSGESPSFPPSHVFRISFVNQEAPGSFLAAVPSASACTEQETPPGAGDPEFCMSCIMLLLTGSHKCHSCCDNTSQGTWF